MYSALSRGYGSKSNALRNGYHDYSHFIDKETEVGGWLSNLPRIPWLVSGKARIGIQGDCPCEIPLEYSPSPPDQPKAAHFSAGLP